MKPSRTYHAQQQQSLTCVVCDVYQGIIHRDLKANNIFCSAHGIVKLGDFGISKALGDNQNVARTMVGTPYYMSPEILKVQLLCNAIVRRQLTSCCSPCSAALALFAAQHGICKSVLSMCVVLGSPLFGCNCLTECTCLTILPVDRRAGCCVVSCNAI